LEDHDFANLKASVSLLDRGHDEQGLAILEDLRERYPNNPVILGSLGMIALGKEEYTRAEQLLDLAIEAEPRFYPALVNKGILLVNLGDLEGGLALYGRAIEMDPRYAEAYSNRGNALALLERTDEALADYIKAIELKPGFADAHYNLGYTLFKMGRTEEAVEELERAITLNPTHLSALQLKLTIHLDRGESGKARTCRQMMDRAQSR